MGCYYWHVGLLKLSIICRNLLYTATIIPYTISFVEENIPVLTILDYISDFIWLVDIILTFFCAYEDNEENLIISRKVITFKSIFYL